MTRTSHPPAWYRDPHHPHRLRRWDGRAWTGDVRPAPDWLRELRVAPGPPSPTPVRRLWFLSAGCLVAAMFAFIVTGSTAVEVDRIEDARFVAGADAVCGRTGEATWRPYTALPADEREEPAALQGLVEGFRAMVVDLRALEVAPADEAVVDRWLAAWDEWVRIGDDYVQAAEAGDTVMVDRLSRESRGSKVHINRFAVANGLRSCVF